MKTNIFKAQLEDLDSAITEGLCPPCYFIIKLLIRDVLPEHYDSRFEDANNLQCIIDSKDNISDTFNVIILDNRIVPIGFKKGYFYPIDSVINIIDFVGGLTLDHLISINDKIKNLAKLRIASKGMLENGKTYYPLYSIIACYTDLNWYEIKDTFIKNKIEKFPSICVLTKGYFDRDNMNPINNNPIRHMQEFLIQNFSKIEENSASRGSFDLRPWINPNFNYNCKEYVEDSSVGQTGYIINGKDIRQ